MRSNHCHYKSTQYKTITDLVFWWDEESAANGLVLFFSSFYTTLVTVGAFFGRWSHFGHKKIFTVSFPFFFQEILKSLQDLKKVIKYLR